MRTCASGTQGCTNNSKMYCGDGGGGGGGSDSSHIFGQFKYFKCADGTPFHCNAGVRNRALLGLEVRKLVCQ